MAGFLYFADGIVNPIADPTVAQLELGYAFERKPMFGRIEGRTPSGAAGTIMADESRLAGAELAYRPEQQTWRKRPGDDCLWVGYWNDQAPTPEGLRRSNTLLGEDVEMGDGRLWTVPRLLWHGGESGFQLCLPTYFDLDGEGQWTCGAVDERYADLKALSDRLHAGVYLSELPDGQRLTTDELLTACSRLLAVNYAVAPLECAVLKLFKGGGLLRRIAEAAVDFDQAMEWLEKKSADDPPVAAVG